MAESVVKQPPATSLNLASQAFARVVSEEPTSLVPGWAGTPPSRSSDLPQREFTQIDQREAFRKISYRCGSSFNGCKKCGEVGYAFKCPKCKSTIRTTQQITECVCPNCDLLLPNVKPRKYYRSGYSVRKAYSPQTTKWTYWCYVCGAFDEHCWETFIPNRGLGKPASHRKTMCSRILRLLEVAEKPEDLKIGAFVFTACRANQNGGRYVPPLTTELPSGGQRKRSWISVLKTTFREGRNLWKEIMDGGLCIRARS